MNMKKLPKFSSRVFLAPMAGITNPAFRLLCKEHGAGLVVTELTSINAIVAKERLLKEDKKKITEFIEFSDKERPLSIQLFGSDLKILEKAVKIISPYADIIDYNMGCPAPNITQQMAGAALLQETKLTREIFKTLVKNSSKPVTLKMRSGVNQPDKFLKIAKIAEEEGITMITLHPRTVEQGYSGKSDWSLIKKLKKSISIPVVGNGDIKTPEDAAKMIKETGCDYIMVGRAAASNPLIFSQINDYFNTGKYKEISPKIKLKLFFTYLKYAKKYPSIKVSAMRMQAMNFSKGCKSARKLRGSLLGVNDVDVLERLMKEFYDTL